MCKYGLFFTQWAFVTCVLAALASCDESSRSIFENEDDASRGRAVRAKFLHIEEMRNKRFNPIIMASSAAQGTVDPLHTQDRVLQRGKGVGSAAQISLFKEESRRRLASKLTSVFEETKDVHLSKQMAKERVKAKVEIKNAASARASRKE